MAWNQDSESEGARIFAGSFVARFDGKGFSKLARAPDISKPFDQNVCDSMHAAVEGIIKHLTPDFVYQVSDEISAFFVARAAAGSQLPFGGKESKICSIGASAASACFSEKFGKPAIFDGRAFACSHDQMPEYFVSRLKSGFKNSVSQLAYEHMSANSMHGMNSLARIARLKELGVDYDSMPQDFKYGRIWFKEKQEIWSDAAGTNIQRMKWSSDSVSCRFSTTPILLLKQSISDITSGAPA